MGCIDYHPDMHGIVDPPHVPLVGQCVPLHLIYCTCCLFRVSIKKKNMHVPMKYFHNTKIFISWNMNSYSGKSALEGYKAHGIYYTK